MKPSEAKRNTQMKAITKDQIVLARIIAGIADAIQILFFPLFIEGPFSPLNDLLDIAVCISLTAILGWHWAFVPTLVIEDSPILDEIPTWSLAVVIATSGRQILSGN